MTSDVDHHTPLAFTVAMSFLMGIVTTIAVYSLRHEPRARHEPTATDVTEVHASTAAPADREAARTAGAEHQPAGAPPEPAASVPPAPVSPIEAGEIVALRGRDLKLPVDGVDRKDLRNTFAEARGSRTHEALDILAPRGTKVRAVEDGRVQKLFTSKAGGLTIYEFDPTETFTYYYAHLDRYEDGLREGQMVKRGDVIGYVGSTGNASPDAPHLHFAIFRLGPAKRWWKGDPINPYLVLTER
jgi:murein DD-endopeptidase MepM/ murein hydrolase activator NlpD